MFRTRRSSVAGVVFGLMVLGATVPAWGTVQFRTLQDIPGGIGYFWANDLSADGNVIAGVAYPTNQSAKGVWWEPSGQIHVLTDPFPGVTHVWPRAISADGSTIVGVATAIAPAPGDWRMVRWVNGTPEVLGTLQSQDAYYGPQDASADGSIIVGNDGGHGFRWTAETGLQPITDNVGGAMTEAWGISADGSIIVGQGQTATGAGAARWTATGGVELLVPGTNDPHARAKAITPDGRVIVGSYWAGVRIHDESIVEAFRWTAEEGFIGLGQIAGGYWGSWATAASYDGQVVLGRSDSPVTDEYAFVWDPIYGVNALQDVLSSHGGVDLSGWMLHDVSAIAADGKTIVGTGAVDGTFTAWIAKLPHHSVLVVPEPGSLALLGAGLTLALRRRR